MNKKIVFKLILVINLIILIFMLLLSFLNGMFLEKYYIYKNKNTVIEIGKNLAAIKDDVALQNKKIAFYESSKGVLVAVIKKDFSKFERFIFLPGSDKTYNQDMMKKVMLGQMQAEITKVEKEIKKNGYAYNLRKDPAFPAKMMIVVADSGENYIVILKPTAVIGDNVNIASEFFIFASLATLLISIIFSIVFSRKFVKPIVELNLMAKDLAKLNFSKRHKITTNDEIGELGETINYLAQELDTAITDLKGANEKLVKEVEEERRIDKMRREFISSVSHELRTPVSIVQAYAEGLKFSVNVEQEKDYYCDVILDEANKMGKLIQELLDLARIESGGAKFEMVEFNLSERLEFICSKYSNIFTENALVIKKKIDKNITITADIYRVEQVISNYINNAVNHVDINKEIVITLNKESSTTKLSIFNSGKHIPEESLARIWDSFYKVDEARTREYGGIGLGLAIAKAILEKHGFSYGVRNIDNGVEFWFEVNN